MKPIVRHVATVAWPAFLAAGVLEIAVFAFVDPATLSLPGGRSLALSADAVYSLAFFVFWIAACALTLVLARGGDATDCGVPGAPDAIAGTEPADAVELSRPTR